MSQRTWHCAAATVTLALSASCGGPHRTAAATGTPPSTKLDHGFAGLRLGITPDDIPGGPAHPDDGYTEALPLTYRGIELEAVYFFTGEKLDGASLSVKRTADCAALHKALEADLGPPSSTTPIAGPGTTYRWNGTTASLKLDVVGTLCAGSLRSKP